jgi:pantothenate kinase-related protein Tda10
MKNSADSKMVTGVAWYRPEQWARLREISDDVEDLDDTYEEWRQKAEQVLRNGIAADMTMEKVDIDVEEVLAWCNVLGLPMNSRSRSRYVSDRLRRKYEAS